MPLRPKQCFQVGAGEGCVITFRRRQEIQKIVEMKKIPKRRSVHLVQLCTLLTRRKVPALLASCLMPLSTLFPTSLCPPSPLSLGHISISPLFLLPSFHPVFFVPLLPLLPPIYLSFLITPHLLERKRGQN